jgi:hypothetical protein
MPKSTHSNDEQYLDYVADAFCNEAKKENDKYAIAALALGIGIWGFSGNMIAGLAAGGAILAYSDRSVRTSNRALELIRRDHLAAPFLPKDRLQDFEAQFGKELCVQQLQEVRDRGIPMAGHAEDLLLKHCPELERQPLKSAVAPTTADDVFESGTDNPESAYEFLKSLTTAPLQPVIIAGLPGSGKGILAAMALAIGVRDNGLKFRVFNPKPKLAEAGYWNRAEIHYLKNRLQHDENMFVDLMTVLEEFAAEGTRRNDNPGEEHQPFVLLLEEINAVTGLFTPKQKQLFKAKITALASLLRGCNMALWMSAQSINLDDLGLTGKSNRAMFTAIVAVGADREAVNGLCHPLGIPFDNSKLTPGDRYWLTTSGYYPALPSPTNIPTYPDWGSVPNLVDLRPGAEQTPTHQIDGLLADVEQQEQAIAGPDEFTSTPKLPSEQHEKLAEYMAQKRELPVRKVVQNWGTGHDLNTEEVWQLLIDLQSVGLLDTFTPVGTNAEWVRWVG